MANIKAQKTRKLTITYSKTRLYSSIALTLRRMRIPSDMLGADLLTGVVFGKIRHPEITVEEAIKNAVEASRLPGCVSSYEEGLDYIIEALDVSSRKDLFYLKTLEEKEKIVQEVVDNFFVSIRKSFCYETAAKVFENVEELKTTDKNSIGAQAIKSMLFKKLYNPDSTFECITDYAMKKIGKLIDEKVSMNELTEYMSQFITGETLEDKVNSIKDLLEKLEEKAYEKNPSE